MKNHKRIDLSKVNFSKIAALAKGMAVKHLESAECLARERRFNTAYTLLVFSLEESAKARICEVYDNFRGKTSGVGGTGLPLKEHITKEKIRKIFDVHEDKHITMATQAIFFGPMNTFDTNLIRNIGRAIREKDPFAIPEILNLLKVFKKLQLNREQACFISWDGNNVQDFEQEYNGLFPYAKSAVERHNQFSCYKNIHYSETEKSVKEMLEKI